MIVVITIITIVPITINIGILIISSNRSKGKNKRAGKFHKAVGFYHGRASGRASANAMED